MPSANSYATPGTPGGNREDLRDVLTILEPEGTPVTSMIKKGASPKATFIEVLADTLDAPSTDGEAEGNDVNLFDNKANERQRFGNNIHKKTRTFAVSDVQQAVSRAGGTAAVPNEFDYAKAKALRELKRDCESILCGPQEMQTGSATLGWRTRGLFKWAQSTAQAVNPVPTEFLTPAGNIFSAALSTMTEGNFNDILQSLYTVYGERRTYQCVSGVDVIEAVDNFTRVQPSSQNQRYTVFEYATQRQITLNVKIFDSSFGIAEMVPSQFVNVTSGAGNAKSALFLNMMLLELQFLEGMHAVNIDEEGGGPRGYCRFMASLCVKNPRGLGKIDAT